jgi:pimeloyl-ACP methyl ester carboxylesterase
VVVLRRGDPAQAVLLPVLVPGLASAGCGAGGRRWDAFLDRLWQDWSPGYDVAENLARVKESLRQPANLTAAISYYRDPAIDAVSGGAAAYAAEEQAAWQQAQQPTLYLHGSADGCIGVELVRDAERHLAPGSRMTVVEGAGHFLHLERPEEVNEHVLAWVTG